MRRTARTALALCSVPMSAGSAHRLSRVSPRPFLPSMRALLPLIIVASNASKAATSGAAHSVGRNTQTAAGSRPEERAATNSRSASARKNDVLAPAAVGTWAIGLVCATPLEHVDQAFAAADIEPMRSGISVILMRVAGSITARAPLP
jgi:hypothetical protein